MEYIPSGTSLKICPCRILYRASGNSWLTNNSSLLGCVCICLCFTQSCLDDNLLKLVSCDTTLENKKIISQRYWKWRFPSHQNGSVKCRLYVLGSLLQIRYPFIVLPEIPCVPDSQFTHFWTNLHRISGWLS